DVWACPAQDENDALALRMLQRLLEAEHCALHIEPRPGALNLERIEAEKKPVLICIGSVAPGGIARARHLAKKLRARATKARILVGRWGLTNEFNEIEEQRKLLLAAGADQVVTTLMEARKAILDFCESPDKSVAGPRNRIRDRRGDRQKPALAHALGAERPRSVRVLDQERRELLRQVAEIRHAVIDQVWIQQLPVFIDHLLEKRMAEAEEDAALVLSFALNRMDRLADIGDGDV